MLIEKNNSQLCLYMIYLICDNESNNNKCNFINTNN